MEAGRERFSVGEPVEVGPRCAVDEYEGWGRGGAEGGVFDSVLVG